MIPFFGLLRFILHEKDNHIAQDLIVFLTGMAVGSL
jgi:hypothetical protein